MIFIAVGTPSRRGDGHADLSYVFGAARQIAAHAHRLQSGGDEVHRPGRHRRRDRPHHCGGQPGRQRLRSSPTRSSCARGQRSAISSSPIASSSASTTSARARSWPTSTAAASSRAMPILFTGRRDGRAHQVRRQCLPRHEDHLHQRDRRPVRAGRRRRAGRRARHRSRQPDRPEVPARRARATAARVFPRTCWR